jgi:hypothetical protein
MNGSVEAIADDWVALQRFGDGDKAPGDVFRRGWVLNDLAYDQPELAWQVIRNVVSRYNEADLFTEADTEARRVLGITAAGPLEDLLAEHGAILIDRIEAEARKDRRFFWTVGCVWQNSMTDDVWSRVRRAAGNLSR